VNESEFVHWNIENGVGRLTPDFANLEPLIAMLPG